MTFTYRPEAMPSPLDVLSGRTIKSRPIFTVSLVGVARTVPVAGLADSGADYTIFPDTVGVQLGLDLSRAAAVPCRGAAGGLLTARFLPVTIRASDGIESREWTGIVGFAPLTTRYALLGKLGFLEFFTATFYGDREILDLTVNTLYRGT